MENTNKKSKKKETKISKSSEWEPVFGPVVTIPLGRLTSYIGGPGLTPGSVPNSSFLLLCNLGGSR